MNNNNFVNYLENDKKFIDFVVICNEDQLKTIYKYLQHNLTELQIFIAQIGSLTNEKSLKMYNRFKKYYELSKIYNVDFYTVISHISKPVTGGSTQPSFLSRIFDIETILSRRVDKNKIDHNLRLGAAARKRSEAKLGQH